MVGNVFHVGLSTPGVLGLVFSGVSLPASDFAGRTVPCTVRLNVLRSYRCVFVRPSAILRSSSPLVPLLAPQLCLTFPLRGLRSRMAYVLALQIYISRSRCALGAASLYIPGFRAPDHGLLAAFELSWRSPLTCPCGDHLGRPA